MTQPRIHWSFQLLAGLALLAAVLGIGIYQFVFRGPVEAAREASNLAGEIAGQMAQAFQLRPQIRERNLVVFESDRELAQIVVSETTFRASHGMEHSWLGSTKRFGIGATARARFGFDLQNPMRLEVDPDQREVRVQLPPAELLSLDLSDFEVLRDEQGIWNRITASDRELAMNRLRQTAEESLDKTELASRAEASLQTRVRAILEPMGLSPVFEGAAQKP